MKRALTSLAGFALIIITAVSAQAAKTTVWQIGRSDNSYSDLAIAGDYGAFKQSFPQGVHFRVGKDDPAKAWPFIHPGPADAWAGAGTHPYEIIFQLPDHPKGVYTLTIDFASAHAIGPPTYEVTVNGARSAVVLPRGPGDAVLTDPSKGREYVLSIPMSSAMLKQGENRIGLNCIEGSWAIYDALSLTNDPDAVLPPVTIGDFQVESSPRLTRQDGRLKRIVRVSARLTPQLAMATVALKTDAGIQEKTFATDISGASQTDMLIDEPSRTIRVEATLTCGAVTKSGSFDISPQRRWKLYILPASHVDIGYTDCQERVAQVHNSNISHAIDLCAKYPGFKWNTEAAWVEENYLSMMPEQRKAEFIERAREGRIGCSAVYGSMLTGVCSHEGLIRDLYFAHNAAKRYGIPFDMAISCDVPTHVWTLPSVLSGSGIRYFSAALNYGRDDISKKPMSKPFYWEGPDGGRVLTWFAPMYGWAWRLGLTASVEAAAPKVDDFLRGFNTPDYACDAVLAYGCVEDNRPFDDAFASTVDEWNKRYVSPQIILCRGPEFFRYIEKNWKGKLPVIPGDSGACWEDGVASSAVEASIARRSTEILLTAEKLNALTTALGRPACPKSQFDAAWRNVTLWNEHTWGASCSVDAPQHDQTLHQWKIKSAFATDLSRQAGDALAKGIAGLAGSVGVSEPSVVVYNPLSWATSGLVQTRGADGRTITFRAEDVPPLGYRVFPRKSLPNAPVSSAVHDSQNLVLRNRYYTLQVDRVSGALMSLWDNDLGRELLDRSAPYGMNQYIYLANADSDSPKDVTHAEGRSPVSVGVETRPAGQALIIRTSAHNTPKIISEILLHDDEKRVDITNTINKTETLDKESGYFAFPFRLTKPRFHVELPDGVLCPNTQTQPGGCVQWYCPQDFVAVEDGNCAITWTAIDSPLVNLSAISSRYGGHRELPLDKGYLFAYTFTNVWGTNYKASQGGEMVFRFSLTSAREYDPVRSARFGQWVRCPLIAVSISPTRGHAANKSFSLCAVSPSNVETQSVKQAESGSGLIVRLRELAGHKTSATLSLAPGRFRDAASCNLVEDPQASLKIVNDRLQIPLSANGLATVRLTLR